VPGTVFDEVNMTFLESFAMRASLDEAGHCWRRLELPTAKEQRVLIVSHWREVFRSGYLFTFGSQGIATRVTA
jgi:hypothetical protein